MNRREFLEASAAIGSGSVAADTLPESVDDLTPRTDGGRNVDERDTRWKKFAPTSVGTIKIDPYTYVELDATPAELETEIQIHPSDPDTVYLQFSTTGTTDGQDVRASSISKLTADQADALADALVEAAEGARLEAEGAE